MKNQKRVMEVMQRRENQNQQEKKDQPKREGLQPNPREMTVLGGGREAMMTKPKHQMCHQNQTKTKTPCPVVNQT